MRDQTGIAIRTGAGAGLERARARVEAFDEREIAWQITVMRQNLSAVARPAAPPAANAQLKEALLAEPAPAADAKLFAAEADRIAEEIAACAIRRGSGAAWIGLDWLGDSEVFQLACLGPELYNGVSGIAVFLAAHAAVSGRAGSGELALAGLTHLRKELKSRNAARMARWPGHRRRLGAGLDRLCAGRDGQVPA